MRRSGVVPRLHSRKFIPNRSEKKSAKTRVRPRDPRSNFILRESRSEKSQEQKTAPNANCIRG